MDKINGEEMKDGIISTESIKKFADYLVELGRWGLAEDLPQEQAPKEKPPTNCKNCGAVLKGHVCEYCATRY